MSFMDCVSRPHIDGLELNEKMPRKRRRTRTGRHTELAVAVFLIVLGVSLYFEIAPLAVVAILGAAAIAVDFIIQ